MSVGQNLKFSVGRFFQCPDFEFELDFDRQTPHSNSGQDPDSAVRRRLPFRRIRKTGQLREAHFLIYSSLPTIYTPKIDTFSPTIFRIFGGTKNVSIFGRRLYFHEYNP